MNAYRDAVLEIVTRERDDALHRLQQIAAVNEEAHRDRWAALGLYSAIRTILNRPTTTSHRQENQP